MFISWSPSASDDLIDILNYFISIDDTETGEKIAMTIFSTTDILLTFPESGKAGRILGTRELILPTLPYIIIYEIIDAESIEILRIFHTSRLFPDVYRFPS